MFDSRRRRRPSLHSRRHIVLTLVLLGLASSIFPIERSAGRSAPTTAADVVQFGATSYVVGETEGGVEISVRRSGDTSTAASVSYATADGSASNRSDYTPAFGTLRFAAGATEKTFRVLISDDQTVEGDETIILTLSNPSGLTFGITVRALLTIRDNDTMPPDINPVDDPRSFVRRHYLDFLNREPDTAGLNFWTNEITSCGADAQCLDVRRVNVSAAFFLSIEFQHTGYLVYRLHQAAFGTRERLRLRDFLADTQEIGRGVVVRKGDWEAQLEANKQTFVNEFVSRQSFRDKYPSEIEPSQFVEALNANTGHSLSAGESADLALALGQGTKTRAQVLREVAENQIFASREFNRAFVLMQYFGYLRRNPDDPPDSDFAGYQFWLAKLDSHGGDFVGADMVKSFIVSQEYRARETPAAPVVRAFSDATRLPSEVETRREMEFKGMIIKLRTPPVGRPLTLAEALASVRALLEERAGRAALDAFASSAEARDANKAEIAASGALLLNKPLAALAALMAAHGLEPGRAMHLVNLAGVLTYLDRPYEALAMLDAAAAMGPAPASPAGMNGQAVALANRGYALLLLGRAAEAEPVLRQAKALEPLLSEAKTSLAWSLWLQGGEAKKIEAARLLRAGLRRTLGNKDLEVPPGDPFATPEVVPASELLDLSAGKELRLPDLKIPRTLEQSRAIKPRYDALTAAWGPRVQARNARIQELRDELAQRDDEDSPATHLQTTYLFSQLQREFIPKNPQSVERDPQLRPLYEAMNAASDEYNRGPHVFNFSGYAAELNALVEAERIELNACSDGPNPTACKQAVLARYRPRKCQTTREWHGRWLANMLNLDSAVRTYVQAAYRHMTGIAANLGDPLKNELAQLESEDYAEDRFSPELFFQASSPWAETPDDGWPTWCASGAEFAPNIETINLARAARCPDFLKGGNKATCDLEVFSVSIDCEEISVEFSTPGWVGAFGGVDLGFSGEITVFGGGKVGADVGGVGASARAGFYTKIDGRTGHFTDAGFKTSVSAGASLGCGVEREREMEFGIVSGFSG